MMKERQLQKRVYDRRAGYKYAANTSAASIPLALDVAVRQGRVKRGDTVMLEGVGGGFTWGAVLLDY